MTYKNTDILNNSDAELVGNVLLKGSNDVSYISFIESIKWSASQSVAPETLIFI